MEKMTSNVLDGDSLVTIYETERHVSFNPVELESFLGTVRERLGPLLEKHRRKAIDRYDYSDVPQTCLSELVDDLDLIIFYHSNWPGIESIIYSEKGSLDDWIFRNLWSL